MPRHPKQTCGVNLNMCRISETAHVSSPGGTAIVVNAGFSLGEAEPGDSKATTSISNPGGVRL